MHRDDPKDFLRTLQPMGPAGASPAVRHLRGGGANRESRLPDGHAPHGKPRREIGRIGADPIPKRAVRRRTSRRSTSSPLRASIWELSTE
jgi:hypothetical protein